MKAEITSELANRINDLHESVLKGINDASNAVNATMQAAAEIGGHVQQIPRGLRIAWLRDNCPSITHKQIAAYCAIATTYRKRPDNALDRRFFKLLGMTETSEAYKNPTKGIAVNWLAWTGKLTGYFGEMTKRMPIEEWHEEEKQAVAAQLKPIAELYKKITEE